MLSTRAGASEAGATIRHLEEHFMTIYRSSAVAFVCGVCAAALVLCISLSGTAAAQTAPPRNAVCSAVGASGADKYADVAATWMNQQLAAGKTEFIGLSPPYSVICAW
jgi:hypothetical protein